VAVSHKVIKGGVLFVVEAWGGANRFR